MFLQRNVASQSFVVPGSLRAVADGSAVTAGATLTVVKDGTAAAAAGTLTHVSGGAWKYVPTAAESDCKILGYVLEATGAVTVCGSIRTTAADPNSASLGLSLAKTTNITGFNDVAATAIVSGGAITTAGGAVSTVTTATSLTNLPAVPADWLTAAGIAASALAGKGDWLTPTVAGRTLGVDTSGRVDVGYVGGVATTLDTSTEITLAAGTVATGTLATEFTATISGSTLSPTTGAYDGMRLLFQSGALNGEAGTINTYTVTSGVATFVFISGQAFTAAPGADDSFVIG